jgi:hypothetical protein
MKHAGPDALDRLEPLLKALRKKPGLKEKSRGTFYRGARAFLHFHEHGPEFFADMRVGEDFERFAASSAAERAALLKTLDKALAADGKEAPRRLISRDVAQKSRQR